MSPTLIGAMLFKVSTEMVKAVEEPLGVFARFYEQLYGKRRLLSVSRPCADLG